MFPRMSRRRRRRRFCAHHLGPYHFMRAVFDHCDHCDGDHGAPDADDSREGAAGDSGHGRSRRRGGHGHFGGHFGGRGPFGGRRPLRFLARRLGLDDDQFATIARVFSDLKTERMQGAADARLAAALYAEAIDQGEFDEDKVKSARERMEAASARGRETFAKALRDIHSVLDPKQRATLALILREMPPWTLF